MLATTATGLTQMSDVFPTNSSVLSNFSCGRFSTYAKMQQPERSARTRFKPGERSSLTSFPRPLAAGPHAWSGCTTDGSSCKTLPFGTCRRHGLPHTPCTRTSSDRPGGPSCRNAHRLVVSNSPGSHASLSHNDCISQARGPGPASVRGPPRFVDLGPDLGPGGPGVPPLFGFGWDRSG